MRKIQGIMPCRYYNGNWVPGRAAARKGKTGQNGRGGHPGRCTLSFAGGVDPYLRQVSRAWERAHPQFGIFG